MNTPTPFQGQALSEIEVRPVIRDEEPRYQEQMARHHYLGDLPKIGNTIWYVATWRGQWLAQLTLSAAALKCGVRDRWIGWDFRNQYDRLNLIANNSRFLILPEGRFPNVGSRVLSLLIQRISTDWQQRFGHPLLLLETFVDPRRFSGSVYRAANWLDLGLTRGFRRTRDGYSNEADAPKRVFVYPLHRHATALLNHPDRNQLGLKGKPKMQLNAEQMRSLPQCFAVIPDPRRSHGRRHRLSVVLALAAAATLCGMRGYQAMAEWVADLGQAARARFGCRRIQNDKKIHYEVPSLYVIRNCLIRVDPTALNEAFTTWQKSWDIQEEPLAIDGKTMKGAIDVNGRQTHILSLVGHETEQCYAKKKVGTLPVTGSDEQKQTNEIGATIPLLDTCDIKGRDITADALLTQRSLAEYIVKRGAHYHFTVKGNQPTLQKDIDLHFTGRGAPDFAEKVTSAHGRIEQRRIWCTSKLNEYLDFPYVGQCYLIERERTEKKTGKHTIEVAIGRTSRPADQASPERLLQCNRGHWRIEAKHYKLDWNFDEDRSSIRTGHGPENTTCLRHFALSVLKFFQKPQESISSMMRRLARHPRTVLDYLRLTANSGATTGASG